MLISSRYMRNNYLGSLAKQKVKGDITMRFHNKKWVMETCFKQFFPISRVKFGVKIILNYSQTLKSFFMSKKQLFLLWCCLVERFLHAEAAPNKFKSEACIQKCIHLRDWRGRDFEVKRKRSSMAKWGFKRPHCQSSRQKQPINKNTARNTTHRRFSWKYIW